VKPYYADDLVTIYHGAAREVLMETSCLCPGNDACGGFLCRIGHILRSRSTVIVTDPPYGIDYQSGKAGSLARSIEGDTDTSLRDEILEWWSPLPALVFGSWRIPRPKGTRQLLVWDSMGALGMGALDLPWKPAHQEIYVLGKGFSGYRGNDVLRYPPVQSMARTGRVHPNEKPVPLMRDLIAKCPPGAALDPFMGSGSTLVAAKSLNRKAIGIEIEERYCEIAARRCSQEVLGLIA
jgi:hypothetical protein